MTTRGNNETRTRILDAAEAVFSECGFDGASIRAIVQLAGVNLATIYYYFRSKEELLEAVFHRRLAPIKEAQLGLLQQAKEQYVNKAIPVEVILQALLKPPLQVVMAKNEDEQLKVRKLLGRVISEPSEWLQQMLILQYKEVRENFVKAFQSSLSHLPLTDLMWRLEFVWGGLAMILCNPTRILRVTNGLCDPRDTKAVLDQMTAFFAAGLKAPAASASTQIHE